MFGVVKYNDWMDDHYGHLINLYNIYDKYKKEGKVSFDDFCYIIFKSDFNIM